MCLIILKSFIPIIEKLESYFKNGKSGNIESNNIVYGCLKKKESDNIVCRRPLLVVSSQVLGVPWVVEPLPIEGL